MGAAVLVAWLGWLAAAAAAAAAAQQEEALTLVQAIERAEEHNPDLAAVRQRALALAARGEAAGRARWPRLSLTAGWHLSDLPSWVFADTLNAGQFTQEHFAIPRLNDPGGIAHLATTATVELPLDLSGRIAAQARSQQEAGRAAAALADESRLALRLRVTEAYCRAALARRAVAVTARAAAGARSRESEVEARVGEGAALAADLLRARVRRRQREADLAEREADDAVAMAALARLLGAAAGVTFVAADLPAAPGSLEGDPETWSAAALARRPSVAAAAHGLESARRTERAERRGAWPDVAAWAHVQDDRNRLAGGGRSYGVGAQLRWLALDPARGRRRAAAASDRQAAEQEARAAADQVRLEAVSAFRRAQAARERFEAAAGGSAEGREALRVVQERRRAGLATLTDELETEAASLAAELEEIRAAAEAAIADALLERAVGGAPLAASHERKRGEAQ